MKTHYPCSISVKEIYNGFGGRGRNRKGGDVGRSWEENEPGGNDCRHRMPLVK